MKRAKGKDLGFHTDRLKISPAFLGEKFWNEWLHKHVICRLWMNPESQRIGAYRHEIEDIIQRRAQIHARSVSYVTLDEESEDYETYRCQQRSRYALVALDRGDTEALRIIVDRKEYEDVQMDIIDVRDELSRLTGEDRAVFTGHLYQLLFGYAQNLAPMMPDNDSTGLVYNNVHGHVTVFPYRKSPKWTDTTWHEYDPRSRKKNWSGRIFIGSDTKKGLAMRLDGGILCPSAEMYLHTTKELAGQANLYHPYTFGNGKLVFNAEPMKDGDYAWYRQGQKQHPAQIKFLSMSDYSHFADSRVGPTGLFKDRMDSLLSGYLTLRWWDYPDTELTSFSRTMYDRGDVLRKCADALRGRLTVSKSDDDIPDEDTAAVIRVLRERLGFAEGDVTEGFDPAKYNIVLKHDAEHYERLRKKDAGREFYLAHPDAVMQGITDEGLRDRSRLKGDRELTDILSICLISLTVKGDIHAETMSVADLRSHGFTKTVGFAFARRLRDGDGRLTHYYAMTADPVSGRLSFRHFTYDDIIARQDDELTQEDFEMRSIAGAFGLDGRLKEHNPAGTELAVWEDLRDIYAIRKTWEHAVPDIDRMFRAFSAMDRKVMTLAEFEEAYGRFREDMLEKGLFTAEDLDEYRRFIETAFDGRDSLPYSRLQKALDASGKKKDSDGAVHKIHCSLYRKLKTYLPELAVMPRSKAKAREFGLEALRGAWWFRTPEYDPDDPSTVKKDTLSYFVGSSTALSETIARGFVIRQISRCSGGQIDEEFAETVMSLMIVDFVRLGQWSVIPFPAKYLREYKDFTDIEAEAAERESGADEDRSASPDEE